MATTKTTKSTKTAAKPATKKSSTITVASLKAELEALKAEVTALRTELANRPKAAAAAPIQASSNAKYDKAAEVTAKLHRLAKSIHGEGPLVPYGLSNNNELEKLL